MPVPQFGIIERGYRNLTFAHVHQAQRCVRCTFRGLSLYFLYQKGNLIRIKTGLDTYLIRIQSEGREWGVGSVVLDFRVFGAPQFSVQSPQNTYFKGFWGLWTENRGAPKTRKSSTTDPTPHPRPSDPNPYPPVTVPPLMIILNSERSRGQKRKGQKLLKTSRKKKMFAEDISEDFSDLTFTGFYSTSQYLRNLRGRLLSSEKFSEVFTLWVFTLKPFLLNSAHFGKSTFAFLQSKLPSSGPRGARKVQYRTWGGGGSDPVL